MLRDALIPQQTLPALREVLAPKASGAQQARVACASLPCSTWACFSSVAAFVGSAGQSIYAAANAAMDSMTADRLASGLEGVVGHQPTSFGVSDML